jgi:hypothetical protein
MRFVLPLIAGLMIIGVAPVTAADAASNGHLASSVIVGKKPAKAAFGAGPASVKKVGGRSVLKVDGRPYFTYDASPGGYLEDHIAIINFATRAQTLNVYPVDAVSGKNGTFNYAPKSGPRRQVGKWLTVVSSHFAGKVTVKARSMQVLSFFLHVPANASPGDHGGAIIVSLTSLVKGKHNELVKFEQRIATRVIVRVSGPLHPRLTIQNLHASYAGGLNPFASGDVAVSYTVNNTGNVLLGAAQQVSSHGLFGAAGHAPGVTGVPLLLPGGAYDVRAHVSGIFPVITVTATARLAPEGLRGDVNPGVHVITASVTVWVIPWPLLGLIIVILLGLIAMIIWRRRRTPRVGRDSIKRAPQGVKA